VSDRLAGLRRYALVRLAKVRAGVLLDEERAEEMLRRGGRIARALRLAAGEQTVSPPSMHVNPTIPSGASTPEGPRGFTRYLRVISARLVVFLRSLFD